MQKKNLFVVSIVMLVNAISYGVIIPLMYPYASTFGMNATGMGMLFASFSLAQFIATPIFGRLSDRYGRKPLLLISLLGSAISLFVFANAKDIVTLFTARIIDGLTGGNISVAQAIVADTTDKKDRAKGFGILGALFGFGFAFGPALGGVLGEYSIRTPFLFSAVLALLGVVLGMILLTETNTNKVVVNKKKLFDFKKIGHALVDPATGPIFLVSILSLIGTNAMIIGFNSTTVDILKLPTSQIGLLFTEFGIVSILMQGFGIKIILEKIKDKRRALLVFLALSGISIFAVSFVHTYFLFAFAMLVFGLVSSPTGALITALLSERTKIEDQGGILGLNQSYASLAQIVGPLAAGLIVKASTSYVFVFAAILFLISLYPIQHIAHHVEKTDL